VNRLLPLAATGLFGLVALQACPRPEPTPTPVVLDLTERLEAGQVRAGVVTDEAALFGGVSAEGRAGDVKIYNDRVQFVVQGARKGSYYLQTGGGVIDADIVRPEGAIGRDLVEKWLPMLGFGRLMLPDENGVQVVSNGSDGSAAVVRVTGQDAPLDLLSGVVENPDFFPEQGLDVTTEYRLEPDSWLLEVTTTITTSTPVDNLAIGDILMGAPELADGWASGTGLQPADGPRQATGYIDMRNGGAIAILGAEGPLQPGGAADLIAEIIDLRLVFQNEGEDLGAGETRTFTRYYGAGPDLATLTDAASARSGATTQTLSGTALADDGPVPGARVHVLVDDQPYTVAITDENGEYRVQVPDVARSTVVIDGRGRGMFFDLPAGSPAWPAFSAAPVYERSRIAYASGAPAPPIAEGRGISAPGTNALGRSGTLRVTVDDVGDDLPFSVRVGAGAPGDRDDRLVRRRPGGHVAAGWARGGTLELTVEPGTWDVLVHRGMRYELHTETVTIEPGQVTEIEASLPTAFVHPGFVLGDPHAHASPSGDGGVSMEERILVTAGAGIQVHFGSDHDRVADYRPLVSALGLDPVMKSVVADEVSSVLRGHMNAYPLVPDPTLPNGGAVEWWADIPESTDDLVRSIRTRHGADIVVQANHPLDSGVAEYADWEPGFIGTPSFWTDDLDAMEVLNDGEHEEYFPVYLDLLNHGYVVTPVGVSDSHTHFQSDPGVDGTWIGIGSSAVADFDEDALLAAYAQNRTIASLGVFLDMDIAPGTVLTAPTTLDVDARSASWVGVDRLILLRDGEPVETVPGPSASFELTADQDASFVVVAEGDSPMLPLTNKRPWAASAAILLDLDGDGWDAPLPPLTLND
jgi:hypothetical protein